MNFIVDRNNGLKAQTVVYPVFKDQMDFEAIHGLTIHSHMGESGKCTWFFGRNQEENILLVGLGEQKKFQMDRLRAAFGTAGRALNQEKQKQVRVSYECLQKLADASCTQVDLVMATVEGWLLGTYAFDAYKSKKAERHVELVQIELETSDALEQAIQLGKIRAEGVIFARELGNEPANRLRPETFVKRIRQQFSNTSVSITVYQGEELEKRQMNGLLSVGKGSKYPPAFVELRYCTDPSKPLVALVGKGMTYDAGGISLKSGRDLSDMRMDMCGAAAVVGALDIIVKSQMAVNLLVLVATAENIPDGGAMLPGDVIQYPNGVTVQVGNTDAEGRLILADALIHAKNLGAVECVDIATLTGACIAALGERMAGVWGDDALVDDLRHVGQFAGDRVWPMPLEDEYEDLLKSHYADISNIGKGPYAGAITAALFLRKFVDPSMKWAHVDMAGPMEATETKGYLVAGATGYGARLLADFVAVRSK
ncbi:leucyl aminopeptidase family protein [Fodinisporobacter ferrooxydans]|uniref:Probable cytosol aminopeptidase n=1 Tax=Fodinisporobacter ferrooxydans TaxID=2901836 RepID=A0ABY4CHG2_9BACL|nr:leucyl aminopeptidase family protein [Alicyclobacillaceae bacterium MYW30-H2]